MKQLEQRGLLTCILQDGQAGAEVRFLQYHLDGLRQHIAKTAHTPAMMLRGAVPLAEADAQHLDYAALIPAAEVRVCFDTGQGDNVVSLESVAIPVDRFTPAIFAKDHS